MTPENRARMQAVLRASLRLAYLPGSPDHDRHAHAGAAAHAGARHEPASRATLTPWGTPATSIASGNPDALVDRFCQELEALAGVAYRLDRMDRVDHMDRADGASDAAGAAGVDGAAGATGADGADIADIANRANRADAAAERIAAILARSNSTQIVAWSMEEIALPGLAEALAARGITVIPPDLPFADPERAARVGPLAASTVGLTGAQAAIADSGSLVLASGPGRGRLASLLTPIHVAILHRDRILPSLPDLFTARPDLPTLGSNMVIVTGPSRTADIEQTLSRGVHGPGEIHVIIV